MRSRYHMRSLIKSKHKQLSKNIKEKKFYRMKNNKYFIYSFTESNDTNQIQSIDNRIKNRLHRQCEAYDDYQSKYLIFIYSDEKNYVEKWKNKKLIEWITTNILPIHLQNQTIPINYYWSIIKSKNRLHRQCEAYDDYQLKYPTYHSLIS